jgi:predicted small lipoprotein YifL
MRFAMKLFSLFTALFLLSACGADGPPEPPGVNVSAEVQLGVTSR